MASPSYFNNNILELPFLRFVHESFPTVVVHWVKQALALPKSIAHSTGANLEVLHTNVHLNQPPCNSDDGLVFERP